MVSKNKLLCPLMSGWFGPTGGTCWGVAGVRK